MNKELDLNKADFESLASEIISGGNSIRFRARGASMRPFIFDGDYLEVCRCQYQSLKIGDIILFKNQYEGIIAHRIIRINPTPVGIQFRTQGDANNVPDGWILGEQIIGQVVGIGKQKHKWKINNTVFRITGRCWRKSYPLFKKLYKYIAPLHQVSLVG